MGEEDAAIFLQGQFKVKRDFVPFFFPLLACRFSQPGEVFKSDSFSERPFHCLPSRLGRDAGLEKQNWGSLQVSEKQEGFGSLFSD